VDEIPPSELRERETQGKHYYRGRMSGVLCF